MKNLKVVKIGGSLIDNRDELENFLINFAAIEGLKILVHGGGKQASELALELGVEVKMIDGRRFTDENTLDIISMIYAGKLNKTIVVGLQKYQCNAIGLTGADGNCVVSNKRASTPIDYGFAGDIQQVNYRFFQTLLEKNITPVLCALSHDGKGQLLNTNADTMAAAVASGLSKYYEVELNFCFDKSGVLLSADDDSSVINSLNEKLYEELFNKGAFSNGMLPKLKNAFSALKQDVKYVRLGKPEMLFDSKINHTTITL